MSKDIFYERIKCQSFPKFSKSCKDSLQLLELFIKHLVDGTFIPLSCLERRLLLPFHKRFALITFLSLKCFTAFFSMELLVRYKIYPLEIGNQRDQSTYALGRGGFVSSVHVRLIGGVKFSPFWCIYIEQMAL